MKKTPFKTQGTATPSLLNRLVKNVCCLLAYATPVQTALLAQTGHFEWATLLHPPRLRPYAVAADAFGNGYLTGSFYGVITYGGAQLSAQGDWSEAFIAKYNPDGGVEWVRQVQSIGGSTGICIAADSDGTFYLGGAFGESAETHGFVGSATFGSETLIAAQVEEGYLAKYNSAGEVVWVRQVAPNRYRTGLRKVGVNRNSQAGFLARSIDIDDFTTTSLGRPLEWGVSLFPAVELHLDGFAIDQAGNSYCAGPFSDSLSIAGYSIVSSGVSDAFLVKYDQGGSVQWLKAAGTSRVTGMVHLAVDDSGFVYQAGTFYGTWTLPDGTTVGEGGDIRQVFVAKYDPDGSLLWARSGIGNSPSHLVVDAQQHLYVRFSSSTSTSPDPAFNGLKFPVSHSHVVRLNPDGETVGVMHLNAIIAGMAATGDALLITGSFRSEVSFGDITLSTSEDPGYYVAKLVVPPLEVTPSIQMQWQKDAALVIWNGPGYSLESRDTLAPGEVWEMYSAEPVIEGDRHTVTIPASATAQFFRLVKP
jgi:hypothetical protein